ncbi:MAG: hypothetical protein RI538_11835 [Salibaculum sp.]|uniref:hypothetical protein n=1 Tax=Roseovarius halophilus (ex Wu et al. 2025) TaxID=3376060 RepID=UPI00286FB84E|nr:hypothetical protein [Salibaculum sp.]MDR9427513.1 hypothetical protein [Salibaculum sp.]MDR9483448.1 hypothetical protein [Salibaculum sp.]
MRRPLLPGLLALLVALTAQQLAVARGQPQAAGQVALCADGSIVMVTVGHDGTPIGPAHICPDVALGLMVALDLPDPDQTAIVHIRRAAQPFDVLDAVSHIHIASRARDPPLSA